MTDASAPRPDYGLDAPNVVRNLFVGAAASLLLWGSIVFGLWSGQLVIPVGADVIRIEFGGMGLGVAVALSFTGCWMIWESKVGKLKSREGLLKRLNWTGNEQVLDLGCGRGLLLIGAAKRLTTGKATGVDIWQSEDLSGNRPEATLENAKREGVDARVEIKTADMRELPFADASFDVVVSRAAIHNLYSAADRSKAIREVVRVLKPGGRALIEDIRHGEEYAGTFAQNGCADVQRVGSRLEAIFAMLLTMGSLRPDTLLVKKAG